MRKCSKCGSDILNPIVLKVKKVKRIETDGKADTHSVLLEGTKALGVDFALTITCEDEDELQRIVSTVPGRSIEMVLTPILYGDIESYGPSEMDPAEYNEIITGLEAIPDDPGEAEAMQADPYADPREETQKENLEARRRAFEESEAAVMEKRG